MRLSKNFTLKELTRSNTALRLGIDNEPSKEGIYKLTLLATEVLQPLRDCLGALRITSGFRSPELNKAIGGSTKSQHCKYEAVDLQYFKRGKMDNIKIYQALKELGLPFDQVILEFGDATQYVDPNNPAWIHLSYTINDNRCQELVAYKDENNKTKYRTVINYKSV
jgi:zinc D-Ala-D-Ala carboxypeptidase